MAKVILGNHAAVFVPLQDRDKIRQFYRDVLDGKITSEEDQKDLFRVGDNFYLAFLHGDYADESKFLRSGRSIWLEIKSDNVEEMSPKILESGVVEKLDLEPRTTKTTAYFIGRHSSPRRNRCTDRESLRDPHNQGATARERDLP